MTETANDKKGDWKAKLALITIALCLVLTGVFISKLADNSEPKVVFVNQTIVKEPTDIVSTGPVATPNATAKAIEALGGPDKVKIASQKENKTTIRTVETNLIVKDENTSVSAPETRVVAGKGVTMIFGNETTETKKTRSVKLIEVEQNVSKTEAKP